MKRTVLSLILLAATAHAQAPDERSNADKAAALFDEGKRHFDIAEYSAAVATWKQAYLLSNEPLLLFNIGQAYRLAGNCAEANRFYLNYKRIVPKPANTVELDAAMAKCAGVEPATGESEALPPTTGEPKPPEPKPEPPRPPPVATQAPAPAPVPPATVDEGSNLRSTGLIVGGAGVALGATAVFFALQASSHASTVESQPNRTTWSPTLANEQSTGQRDQTVSRVLGIGGVVAIAAGATMWWLGHERESTTRVGVIVVPGRTEVALSCAF